MRRHRTTARVILFATVIGLTAGPAAARLDPGGPARRQSAPPAKSGSSLGNRIIFPVLGRSHYGNDYGDPRPQGRHEGIDIVAPRKALAVAAEAGRVKFHVGSGRAGCMLYLNGVSGTTYVYIHLNNDLGTTNDNRGSCAPGTAFAPGLKSGARVAAGEPVGFVGDSGDADGVQPHLHFEVHPNDGRSTNPFPYLNRGWRLLFAAPRRGETSLWLKGTMIAQQSEAMKVQVTSLGVRATGLKLNGISRPVSLGVSPLTVIERMVGAVTTKERATVWTEIAPVTLDALLGKPGALTAKRVLLGR